MNGGRNEVDAADPFTCSPLTVPAYMFSTIAFPNSLVLSSVAPVISRSKS